MHNAPNVPPTQSPLSCNMTASWWILLGKVLRTKLSLFSVPNTCLWKVFPWQWTQSKAAQGKTQVCLLSCQCVAFHILNSTLRSERCLWSETAPGCLLPHIGARMQPSEYKVHWRGRTQLASIITCSAFLNSGHQMLGILLYSQLFLYPCTQFLDGSRCIFWVSEFIP